MDKEYTAADAEIDQRIAGIVSYPCIISVNVICWIMYVLLPDYHMSWVWWNHSTDKSSSLSLTTSQQYGNTSSDPTAPITPVTSSFQTLPSSHFQQAQTLPTAIAESDPNLFQGRQLDEYWWPTNKSELNYRIIYNNQFPDSCEGKQFMVYHLDRLGSRNIGSIITQVVHWFQEAMVTKRILVFGKEPWQQASECADSEVGQTWECFFQPISSCSWRDIKNYSQCEETRRNHSINNPWVEENDFECVFLPRSYWRHGGKQITKALLKVDLNFHELRFRAFSFAFLFRLNEKMQERVNSNLKDVLAKNKIDPDRTAVMPIRGSDKCHGHGIEGSAKGEDDCVEPQKYVERLSQYAEAVFPKDKNYINTIIVTSEDSKRVKEVQQFGKRNGFNVVFNHFDVMQGTGSANDLKGHTNTTNFDVMVSVFTNLQLIMRGEYFVQKRAEVKHHSSWHYIMVQLRKWVPECNPRGPIQPNHFIAVQRNWRFFGGINLWDWDHQCTSYNPFSCMQYQGTIASVFKNYDEWMTEDNLITDTEKS